MEKIKIGRASLFVGAGGSKEANFPDTEELTNLLISNVDEKIKVKLNGKPFGQVIDILYNTPSYGTGWVREKIVKLFFDLQKTAKSPPSNAHFLITEIKWRTIFTTNYDCLIEMGYQSNKNSAQQCLPVYNPDLKIKYHEEERVRIIKLHGSVEEAARDSNHTLVFTFNEMQESRRKNDLFYELLRDEAVNGPLIFVGFKFKYPGASSYATSPEFDILSQMLLTMGPSADWHYCIFPHDENNQEDKDLVETLKNKKIMVINATFLEFFEELKKRLIGKGGEEKKASINVPVGTNSMEISRDEYIKDKRQFEILHSEMFKGEPPSVKDTLNGSDNWLSFYNRQVMKRECRSKFLGLIEEINKKNGANLTLLSAPLGWGKTFLLKDMSITFYEKGIPVIWLNPLSNIEMPQQDADPLILGRWDVERISRAIDHINKFSEKKIAPILIADECSDRMEELSLFYNNLSKKDVHFTMIISVDEELELAEEYPVLAKAVVYNPSNDNTSRLEIEHLVDFCFEKNILNRNNISQKQFIMNRILQDEAESMLIYALQVIYDKEHRPFNEIVSHFLDRLDTDVQRNLVIAVSALNRFGSLFLPRLYTLTKVLKQTPMLSLIDDYNKCLNKKVLFEKMEQGEPCVYTLHPLLAERYLTSGKIKVNPNELLLDIIGNMSSNLRDLEVIRKLTRKINDTKLAIDPITLDKLFEIALKTVHYDWVVCHQYSKFLLKQEDHPKAIDIINIAIKNNPRYPPLYHTRGNIRKKWGERLYFRDIQKANEQFELAAKDFSINRLQAEPNEYGFVTELDMLIFRINQETDEQKLISLKIEGRDLYERGLKLVSSTDLKYLTKSKYKNIFVPQEATLDSFCKKIEEVINLGTPSVYSVAFYVKRMYEKNADKYSDLVKILHQYQTGSQKSILLWVTEAGLHANESNFIDAARCLESAKRMISTAEKKELYRDLYFFDLIVSFVLGEYKRATKAQEILNDLSYLARQTFPKGYIWKMSSKTVPMEKRALNKDAKIFKGTVDYKTGFQFATLSVVNDDGETFYLSFNPKFFGRTDFRAGDSVEFIVTILPSRLRADNPNSTHFINTPGNIYVN